MMRFRQDFTDLPLAKPIQPFVRYWNGRLVVSRGNIETDRRLTFRERFMWRLCRRVPTP